MAGVAAESTLDGTKAVGVPLQHRSQPQVNGGGGHHAGESPEAHSLGSIPQTERCAEREQDRRPGEEHADLQSRTPDSSRSLARKLGVD